MIIRELDKDEIEAALPLVWDVFCKYEAGNYPIDGKEIFWKAIHSQEYLSMLTAYGAFFENTLVGIIATRNNGEHIALFFVDGKYHKQGIGRKLFSTLLSNSNVTKITVNSSEFAVDVYKKLGFVQTDKIQESGGIRYIPMVFERKK